MSTSTKSHAQTLSKRTDFLIFNDDCVRGMHGARRSLCQAVESFRAETEEDSVITFHLDELISILNEMERTKKIHKDTNLKIRGALLSKIRQRNAMCGTCPNEISIGERREKAMYH